MKSLVQTVGLLLVLAAVVSVITFMLHYTNNPVSTGGTTPNPHSSPDAAPQLTWPAKVMGWPPGEGDEFEINKEGSFPFWFWNAEKEDVGLSLQNRSCRVCSRVEMCFLAPDEARNFLAWYATSHILNGAVQQPFQAPYLFLVGMLAVEDATVARFAKASYPWQELKESGEPVSVPSGAVGMVRVVWKSDKEGPQRLGADFWTQSAARAGGPRAPTRLEVALSFVPPVRIFPPVATLADLNPRETAEAEFLCWSSTRDQFTLEPKAGTEHPCFETTIRPATPEDRHKWPPELKSQLRSGYVVNVKVHERRSDKQQLDLGPIRRKIELVASPDLGAVVAGVTGQVRGEVRLEGSPEKDRLALQGFSAKGGATRTFVLVSEQPGIELDSAVVVEPPQMGFLSVTLKKQESRGGSTLWDLIVVVPPNRVSGALPRETAVILKILGDNPRRIRIPVSGIAAN